MEPIILWTRNHLEKNDAKGIFGSSILCFGQIYIPNAVVGHLSSLRFIFLAAAAAAACPLIPARQGPPILARHDGSISASTVWRIWAPPSSASPFCQRVLFQEAAAVKVEMAAIRDARDHLHAANEEGMSLHQADTLRTHRSHVNGDIVALLRCGRDIRAETRCSPGCCRAGTVPLVPAAPRPAHLGRRGSSSLLPAQ